LLCGLCDLCEKYFLSPFLEKSAQDLPAFFEENPGNYLYPVVEAFIFQQRVNRVDRPCFRVFRSKYQTPNPCLENRSRTHGTGFNGHVKSAIGKPVIPHPGRPFPERQDFSMSRGIRKGNGPISTAPDHFPFRY
jgi:hypothetical protein